MEPSEEIRRVIDRLTRAIAEGDSESVLGRLSDHPGTLIGCDSAEWWRGQEIPRALSDGSAPIRVRIGVHTGDALSETDGFFGTTIHYAARVAGQALGGEVLVSSVVHELVSASGIDFRESREVELKGNEGRHRVFVLDLTRSSDTKSSTST